MDDSWILFYHYLLAVLALQASIGRAHYVHALFGGLAVDAATVEGVPPLGSAAIPARYFILPIGKMMWHFFTKKSQRRMVSGISLTIADK